MPVSQFFEMALYHPQYGYYTSQNPLGSAGDFITAPEISQVFGDMIGLWCIDVWQQMGAPQKFHLVELGPGTGTLMADMLRALQTVPAAAQACYPALVEVSPYLAQKQKDKLSDTGTWGDRIQWAHTLEDITVDSPVIVIGNEVLDAIAFDQYIFDQGRWHARHVIHNGSAFDLR